MTIPRTPGSANSPYILEEKITPRAWLRTSGGASPVTDDSYGVSSITDTGVGILDVTWQVAFASATSYTIVPITQASDATADIALLDTDTATTATVRVVHGSTGAALDPASGYFIVAMGV